MNLAALIAQLRAATRLMIGIPDYERYVAHRMVHHPGDSVMSYEEFFRNRQDCRYGASDGQISRCC